MTTITAPTPTPTLSSPAVVIDDALLRLHRFLFPERYTADLPLALWSAGTAQDAARMVDQLLADGQPTDTAAALTDFAGQLADVDDLGPADALDAAAGVLEAACARLAVSGFVAL